MRLKKLSCINDCCHCHCAVKDPIKESVKKVKNSLDKFITARKGNYYYTAQADLRHAERAFEKLIEYWDENA